MKYNVLKFVTNTAGGYQAVVSATFDAFEKARTNYFSTAAAFSNAPDVLVAVVKLVDEYGNNVDGFRVVIDNRPEPEPEENTEKSTAPEETAQADET